MGIPKQHSKDCNWIHFFEGTKLEMEINPHPDEPSLWIQMSNEIDNLQEGMYMCANFCPQCGANLREVK